MIVSHPLESGELQMPSLSVGDFGIHLHFGIGEGVGKFDGVGELVAGVVSKASQVQYLVVVG